MSALLTVGLLGVTAAKVLLRSTDHGTAAATLGDIAEAADLLARYRTARGIADVGRKITEHLDAALLQNPEYRNVTFNDHAAVVADITDLIETRLANAHWMIDAVIDPNRLRQDLIDHGGRQQQHSHGKDSEAANLHHILLGAVVDEIARYAPGSPRFTQQALAQLLKDSNSLRAGVDDLIGRPITGAVYATDAAGYWAEIRNLAPPELLDREAVLADLAAFATSNVTGVNAWRGYDAKPLAGKTALLAWFALHPPRDVIPIIHAIRRTKADTTTRTDALTALYAQLACIAERDAIPQPTGTRVDLYRTEALIKDAAACCQALTPPARLLIIIDGIDEDAYYDTADGHHDQPSILSALPATLPSGVHALIARRTNPHLPNDLNTSASGTPHPLHNPAVWRPLTESPHANDNIDPTTIDDLMRPHGGYGYEIAAYLTAAAAPLTASDLTALIEQARPGARVTPVAIQDLINATPGRNLDTAPTLLRGHKGFILGHDTIRTRVIQRLATTEPPSNTDDDRAAQVAWEQRALAPWRARIRAWATTFAQEDWPDTTPDYPLSGAYPILLRDADNSGEDNTLKVLADLLTNTDRMRTMRNIRGTDSATLSQLRDTEQWSLAHTVFNENTLYQLARIIYVDHNLTAAAQVIPGALPAIYARLGKPMLAMNLANAIPDLENRARALADIAQVRSSAGDADQARTLADQAIHIAEDIPDFLNRARAMAGVAQALIRAGTADQARAAVDQADYALRRAGITAPWDRSTARAGVAEILLDFARALADVGQAEQALDLAKMTPELENQVWALTDIAQVLADGGHVDYAHSAVDRALQTARDITDPNDRVSVLAGISRPLANAGYTAQAVQAAEQALQGVDQPVHTGQVTIGHWTRRRVLSDVAPVMATVGHRDQVLEMAGAIVDTEERKEVRAEIAQALAESGHIATALQICHDITDLRTWADVLVAAAGALAADGHTDQALDTATYALPAVRDIPQSWDRSRLVSDIAAVLATAGEVKRALQVAHDITDPLDRASAVSGVAHAAAAAGNADQALQVAHTIDDQEIQASAISAAARAFAANARADEARSAAQEILDPSLRAELLADIARGLADAGKTDNALHAAEQAFSPFSYVPEPHDQAWTLVHITRALTGAGHVAQALLVAEWARNIARDSPDPYHQANVLAHIAQTLADTGHIERAHQTALQAAHSLQDFPAAYDYDRGGYRAHTRSEVTRARMVSGDTDYFIQDIPYKADQAQALADTARTLAAAGRPDQARIAADQALSVARDVREPWDRAWALATVAQKLAAGHADQARRAASQANEAAQDITPLRSRALALAKVAQTLVACGDIDQAYHAALSAFYSLRDIPDPDVNAQMLATIAQALAAVGATGHALQTAHRALQATIQIVLDGRPEHEYEDWVLSGVIRSLVVAGDTRLAIDTALEIPVASVRARVLAAATHAIAAAGPSSHAPQAALEAYNAAQDVLGPHLRALVLADAARALADAGEKAETVLSAAAASWCGSHSLESCWEPLAAIVPDLTVRVVRLLAQDPVT